MTARRLTWAEHMRATVEYLSPPVLSGPQFICSVHLARIGYREPKEQPGHVRALPWAEEAARRGWSDTF